LKYKQGDIEMPAIMFIPRDVKPWDAATTAEFWSVVPWIFLSICAAVALLVFIAYLLAKYDTSPKSFKRKRSRRY